MDHCTDVQYVHIIGDVAQYNNVHSSPTSASGYCHRHPQVHVGGLSSCYDQ